MQPFLSRSIARDGVTYPGPFFKFYCHVVNGGCSFCFPPTCIMHRLPLSDIHSCNLTGRSYLLTEDYTILKLMNVEELEAELIRAFHENKKYIEDGRTQQMITLRSIPELIMDELKKKSEADGREVPEELKKLLAELERIRNERKQARTEASQEGRKATIDKDEIIV